ncbi:Mysoin-binding motif of peroxisomes-domain-containing protein [Dichotomocladium elegans]|nr:Mysoin-binding motif of peroxisomes-domain-containing protein [Dichotomocladium elegans]
MAEFVVYEDTPFAEYLSSIEKDEATVKPTPLHLDGHPSNSSATSSTWMSSPTSGIPRWTNAVYHYWRRSIFHDIFSISLPTAEENAFEETFKYMIVTSPLMSEVLSVHNANKKQRHASPHLTTDYSTAISRPQRAGTLGTVITMSSLMIALGAEGLRSKHRQQRFASTSRLLKAPVIPLTMFLTGGMSIFFVFRHVRRTGIRQLHTRALSNLQTLMEQCEILDSKVHRSLSTIQEIELVSRGYRLSTPLSPISRIEQASRSRRCVALRNRLANVLRRAFITYEEAIIDLINHVDKTGLSRFYDMYNVRSVASLSAVDRIEDEETDNGISLERLRALAHLMHAKRRECMIQFLALEILSDGHESSHLSYETDWRSVINVLAKVADGTRQLGTEIKEALEIELYKPASDDRKQPLQSDHIVLSDSRLRPFVQRLASLDQQIRTMEAKFYLCNDDVRKFASSGEEATTTELREQLKREYMSIQQDLSQLVVEWEAGRDSLMAFLDPPELDPSPSSSTSSPTTEHKDESLLDSPARSPSYKVIDSEDNGITELPLPSRASVFEAVADAMERNTTERSTKSRAERIAEMKMKREKQAREKSTKMDSQTMVHELKGVLGRRITELGLEPEDKPSENFTEVQQRA